METTETKHMFDNSMKQFVDQDVEANIKLLRDKCTISFENNLSVIEQCVTTEAENKFLESICTDKFLESVCTDMYSITD